MDTRNKERPRPLFFVILVSLAFAINVVCVLSGSYIQTGSEIQVGGVAGQKYTAPRRVENIVVTERNRQAAIDTAGRMSPVTELNQQVHDAVIEGLDGFFSAVTELRRKQTPIFTPYNETGGVQEQQNTQTDTGLSVSNTELLLSLDTTRYNNFVEQVYLVTVTLLERGIPDLEARTLQSVKDEMDKLDLSSDMKNLGYQIIILFIEPNLTVNEEATQRARDERAQEYETVYYQQDQIIVDQGHIITLEAYTVLEELGYVRDSGPGFYIGVTGAVMLIALVFAMIIVYIGFFNPQLAATRKECLMLFTVYNVVIIISRILSAMPYQIIPILFCTLLVAMIVEARLAVVVNLGATVICFLITGADINFLLFFGITGVLVSLISAYTSDRSKIIMSSFVTGLMSLLVFFIITLAVDKKYSADLIQQSLFAAVSGMLTVILGFGSLPIWEAAFGIVTAIKLVDLTNPNSVLLRRLTIEAPGTYHHSLIVGNLAETAAFDIGANSNLARAGAYYHDIGKLKYPQYFIENQAGENPHDLLDPYGSAQVISSHITYGLELADQHKLPKSIRDFIHQHHGNSQISFFYMKAKLLNPDGEVNENDFKYQNPVPQFKESAIVMLADGVEAAVRSMTPSEKSVEEIEAFIRKMVKDSLDSGQLMDSGLTIKDIETVIGSFMRVFTAMYHKRMPYPSKVKKNEVKEAYS